MKDLGARVYGLAAVLMGAATLAWGDFATDWQPVPATLPGRAALVYLVGAILLMGGVLINLRRTAAWGAGVLTALFALGLVLLDVTRLAMHPGEFGYWESSAEQLALTSAGLLAFALLARIRLRLDSIGRGVFALCLFVFGTAHFVYADYTATLVPHWLPPGPMFWTYATGAAQIAAGLALLSGVLALPAARLLTAMYIVFGVFVHARLLLATPANHGVLVENILNLALVGAAWIVVDSLMARRP
jgi:uncharacterized membrane protein